MALLKKKFAVRPRNRTTRVDGHTQARATRAAQLRHPMRITAESEGAACRRSRRRSASRAKPSKTHLVHVYEKTGASRQADPVKNFAGFKPTFWANSSARFPEGIP